MPKHTLIHHYFLDINTPEKAYILGFIFADGHNSIKAGSLSIGLQKKDLEILEFIKSELKYSGGIKFRNYNETNPHYSLCIYSRLISSSLLTLGCHSNKTYDCNYPIINRELDRYFILGYFDGDGSCGYDKKGQFLFGIVGNDKMLLPIMNTLKLVTGSKCNLNKNKPNLWCFTINGNFQKIKLRKYLYDGHELGLKRKKLKFYE